MRRRVLLGVAVASLDSDYVYFWMKSCADRQTQAIRVHVYP
jgi:hypothetical protein